jgi:hypothetical protein
MAAYLSSSAFSYFFTLITKHRYSQYLDFNTPDGYADITTLLEAYRKLKL